MNDDLTAKLNKLYNLAKENSLCHNRSEFAILVRKDRATISSALNGSRITKNLVDDVEAVLRDKGVFVGEGSFNVSNFTGSGNSFGIDPKNFQSQDQFLAIVNRLLSMIEDRNAEIKRLQGVIESYLK